MFLNQSQIWSRSRHFHPNKKREKSWTIWNPWTLSRRACSFQTSKIHCFCRFVPDFFYGKNKKSSACEASTWDIPWIETRNKLKLKIRPDFFVLIFANHLWSSWIRMQLRKKFWMKIIINSKKLTYYQFET